MGGGAGVFDGGVDLVEVMAERGLKERALVGEVLVEGSDGDASPLSDARGGEAFFADGEQNLNGGLAEGLYAGAGARLDRRFTRL